MPTLQDIYNSAASVSSQTGVDPAIITAIANSEWGSNYAGQPTSLGITTGAPAGKGSSGGSIGVSAQSGQPAAFWTYQSGAEASAAFRSYIHDVFPQAEPYLGNAAQFFNAMKGSNYDVVYNNPAVGPASGRNTAAENAYWDQHTVSAQQFAAQFGQDNPVVTAWSNFTSWVSGVAQQLPSMQGNPDANQGLGNLLPGPGGVNTLPAGQSAVGAAASGVSSAAQSAWQKVTDTGSFLANIWQAISTPGTWWTILLFGGALVAVLFGAVLIFRQNFIPSGMKGSPA